jgi:hypothetical protein
MHHAVTRTALGLVTLGMAPQAQDLFVEFARPSAWRMFLFLFVLIVVWAMPTHYAARLLLNTDAGFQQLLAAQRQPHQAGCPEAMGRWVTADVGPPDLRGGVDCNLALVCEPANFWTKHRSLTRLLALFSPRQRS